MMRTILVTGSTGFVGSNITPILRKHYNVIAPSRAELDLLDAFAVRSYLERHDFDVLIHLANPTAQNPIDKKSELFERSLRVFTSLAHCNDLYSRMIYLGSGAEYGKHRNISMIPESEFGSELPRDPYGLARYIMNIITENIPNIYNLRLFACHGIGDPPYKLIPYIIDCINKSKPIELRQNTMFDFLYVNDIAPVIMHFIENAPMYKAYNLCSGVPLLIGDIADNVRQQMNSDIPIVYKKDGYGFEYTGCNNRLLSEIKDWHPRSMSEGIKEIIEHVYKPFAEVV